MTGEGPGKTVPSQLEWYKIVLVWQEVDWRDIHAVAARLRTRLDQARRTDAGEAALPRSLEPQERHDASSNLEVPCGAH